VQKGEHLTMYVSVKNVGKGKSYETQANLRNLSGDGLLLHEGRFDISNMQPGEVKKVAFTFNVESALQDPEAKVELSIADRDLRETVIEKVRMPIAVPTPLAQAAGMRAKAGGATLLESTEPGARTFGRLGAGTGVTVLGTAGDMTKVALGDGRFGFVQDRRARAGRHGGGQRGLRGGDAPLPAVDRDPARRARDEGRNVTIKATATDSEKLLDAYVFVGSRKIFYRSNKQRPGSEAHAVRGEHPAAAGVNVITVVARENPDTVGRKTIIVRKDGPQRRAPPDAEDRRRQRRRRRRRLSRASWSGCRSPSTRPISSVRA
jgi:carboxyl-terminal processing protease